MSSGSNTTIAAIRSSASSLEMLSTSARKASGPCSPPEIAGTSEDEALPAGRNDGRRHVRGPEVGDRPHVCDLGISTVSDSGAHHPTAIVAGNVVGQYLRHGGPVAGREVRQERSFTWLAAFSSCGAGRLSSSNLASAASRSASSNSSQRLIRSPSTVKRLISRHSASKPSCEVPRATWVTTAPRSLSRCTASM